MAKIGIEATKAQIEKAVEVTDGSITTGEDSVALKGTASGDSSVAVRGTASGISSTAINADARGDFSVSIGGARTGENSVGIGIGAKATGAQSVAIGLGAEATAARAIQLGEGTNNNGGTLQFGNYQILDSDGKIPSARLRREIQQFSYQSQGDKMMIQLSGGTWEATAIIIKAKNGNNYLNLQEVFDFFKAGKQDVLTFDTTPTENSTNPVTSGGIYTAIETAVGDIDTALTGLISGGGVV